MQMWKKARSGWLSPIATIMSPSWLDVENATIFLISFWVRAQVAVNRAVRAPRHRHRVRAPWLFSIKGLIRTSKKMPATTMVLECSRAETGVGPSIAAGSQGWRPNWADLPVAARMRPKSGRVMSMSSAAAKICCISQVFRVVAIHAMERISPTSPIRLNAIACRAAVLASARPDHQPMSRKDMIPTPSHPMKS